MINESDLKVNIFKLIDSQSEESLKEIYEWLTAKTEKKENAIWLEQGYKDMAADVDREKEANEWIEGTLNSNEL
jgi:disulfide oxidoreductase YuzD